MTRRSSGKATPTPPTASSLPGVPCRLRARGDLHLLDANSLSLAAARSNNPHLSYSMLRRGGDFLPDRRAYTAAIARLPPARALRLFHAVLHHLKRAPTNCPSSSMPDTTFHSLVAAYVGFRDIPTAETIVQAMRDRRLDICALLRTQTDDDHHHNQQMPNSHLLDHIVINPSEEEEDMPVPLLPKAYPPNSRVYTTLMKGYMNAGRVDDVLTMLRAMRREGETSRPDHVTYTTVISTLMDRDGVRPSRVTYNVLIKGYCHQLEVAKARDLVAVDMADAGIKPDVVTYNTLIDGCVLTDDSAGAVALFNDMRAQGIAPSAASYTTLMKAFAASGQPKLAHKVFDEMEKDPRVAVDRAAWNMLVEAYCRLGLLDQAKAVVERMKARGVQPDVATYGSLAKGIAVARKPGEALLLWEVIRDKSAEVDGEALADVCCSGRRWRWWR
uniref:Pentacotripeptide-repeat region of PRORP domain-containing protein n=1 Tax=Leersia perrieri TaxID=77586 RepID=A0A0D9XN35_9ORYZ